MFRHDQQVALRDVGRAHHPVGGADERAHDHGAVVAVVELRMSAGDGDALRPAFLVDLAHDARRALFAEGGRQDQRHREVGGVAALGGDVVGVYSHEQPPRAAFGADDRVGGEDHIFPFRPFDDGGVLADSGADQHLGARRADVRKDVALERLGREFSRREFCFRFVCHFAHLWSVVFLYVRSGFRRNSP